MKYMGGKSRIANDLKYIIESLMKESNICIYVEPFVGGCNVAEVIDAKRVIAADENKYLIAMWKALQKGWNPPESISDTEYIDIRDNKDKYPEELVGVVGFCASFNGRWFSSYAGNSAEVSKNGKIRDHYKGAVKGYIAQREKVKNIEFKSCDYREFSDLEGTLIYCDPPYAGTTGYSGSSSIHFDSKVFWEWVREMSKTNIVIVSEYYGPEDAKIIYEKDIEVNFRGASRIEKERVYTFNDTKMIQLLLSKYNKSDDLENECNDMI